MPQPPRRRPLLRVLIGLVLIGVAGAAIAAAVWFQIERPLPYEVVRGDTLSKIGAQHGVTVEQLMRWNDLESDRIEVGQVLWIRTGAVEAPPALQTPSSKAERAPAKVLKRTSKPPSEPEPGLGLPLPPEQPCLEAPTLSEQEGEQAMVASRGLSYNDIKAAMDSFVGHTLRCVPEGSTPNATLQTELLVACTGRVGHVRVLDDGGLPGEMVECVRETLMYAPLPAHDLPDGDRFRYPLTFRF